jgi:hypothetical protein
MTGGKLHALLVSFNLTSCMYQEGVEPLQRQLLLAFQGGKINELYLIAFGAHSNDVVGW